MRNSTIRISRSIKMSMNRIHFFLSNNISMEVLECKERRSYEIEKIFGVVIASTYKFIEVEALWSTIITRCGLL